MANSGTEEQISYSTRLPPETAERVERYREDLGLTKSEALRRLIEEQVHSKSHTEVILEQMESLAWTSLGILAFVWGFVQLGNLAGIATGIDPAIATVWLIVLGPPFIGLALAAWALNVTGAAARFVDRVTHALPNVVIK